MSWLTMPGMGLLELANSACDRLAGADYRCILTDQVCFVPVHGVPLTMKVKTFTLLYHPEKAWNNMSTKCNQYITQYVVARN
jgi:hypothetical protein